MNKKITALFLILAVLAGCAVGGTLAWLVKETEAVKNTFSVGDINIELKEHEYDPETGELNTKEVTGNEYYYVPGITLPKDPFVKIIPQSEACYLFVKAEEVNNILYTQESGTDGEQIVKWLVDETVWTPVTGHEGYWYLEADKASAMKGATYSILSGDEITITENITKKHMEGNWATDKPQLIFTAAAVQNDNVESVEIAWSMLRMISKAQSHHNIWQFVF